MTILEAKLRVQPSITKIQLSDTCFNKTSYLRGFTKYRYQIFIVKTRHFRGIVKVRLSDTEATELLYLLRKWHRRPGKRKRRVKPLISVLKSPSEVKRMTTRTEPRKTAKTKTNGGKAAAPKKKMRDEHYRSIKDGETEVSAFGKEMKKLFDKALS